MWRRLPPLQLVCEEPLIEPRILIEMDRPNSLPLQCMSRSHGVAAESQTMLRLQHLSLCIVRRKFAGAKPQLHHEPVQRLVLQGMTNIVRADLLRVINDRRIVRELANQRSIS